MEEEEERARKRKMSTVSQHSMGSSTEDQENKLREEENRRLEEERKLREEAEKLRKYQEKLKEDAKLRALEDQRRRAILEEENRRRAEEALKAMKEEQFKKVEADKKRAEEKRIAEEKRREEEKEDLRRKLAEEERQNKLAIERARLDAEEKEKREAAEELRRRGTEDDDVIQNDVDELIDRLDHQMLVEDEKKEDTKETKKKIKVSGQRSKKPTMAREWRKLKEKQKLEAPKELIVEKMEVDSTPEVSPLPPRAKYVPPVFKENENYNSRHSSFLAGAWPHNNKKGIPTPSEARIHSVVC